jgi:hypothetical protein
MKRRRRNLSFRGMLTIWLAMSIAFTSYQRFLVWQDQAIAPREQIALGSMYKFTHWKHDKAFYSFTFAGREYHGSEIVAPNHCFCDVAVYFDPNHPSTNTLVEYRRKSRQDHLVMIWCAYVTIGLVILLAFVLALKKARQKPEANYLDVSKPIT